MRPAPVVSVVDDDEPVRRAIDSLFRSVGFRVAAFASTRGAIAWFAWPVACRRRRTHRRGASDVRSWIGALRAARDGTDHAAQYSRSSKAGVSEAIGPGGTRRGRLERAPHPRRVTAG